MNKSKKIGLIVTLIFTFMLYVNNALIVDNSLTIKDKSAIKALDVSDICSQRIGLEFYEEIECLASIQKAVQGIGKNNCAQKIDIIEPYEFLKRGYGCCFDRARFIEKAARYFGYETRRVFMIQPKYGASFTNTLPLGQASHAASEVLTIKGWIGIDSNEPFLLLDKHGNPKTYRLALDSIDEFPMMVPRTFFVEKSVVKDFDIIYGLYSRHGNFHGKNLPGPEFVISELLWN